jgi:hypothetical protein
LLISIAGNGVAIAWWRKMLRGSATIEDLHRSWSFSTSIKNIAFAGKYFNLIALAALTAKLTIIDSSLMQKAFSTYVGTDVPMNVTNIIGYFNETMPITSTPTFGRSLEVGMSKALNLELQAWSQQGSVYDSLFRNCEGTCYLNVPAAGFEIECSAPVITEVDYGISTRSAKSLDLDISGLKDGSRPVGFTPLSGDLTSISGQSGSGENTFLTANDTASLARAQAYVDANYTAPMFGIHFTREFHAPDNLGLDGSDYAYIAMDITSTSAQDIDPFSGSISVCPGLVTTQSCKLRPAVISYPLQITNYTGAHTLNGVRLGTPQRQGDNSSHVVLKNEPYDINSKQQGGFKVIRDEDIKGSYDDSLARLGGLQLAFETYLGGNASIYFGGAVNYIPSIMGGVYKYLLNGEDVKSNCGYRWMNPLEPGNPTESLTQSVVSSINEIMLLTNIGIPAIWNTSSAPLAVASSYNATMYRDTVHYSTNKWYMIGAVISNFICVLCVLPSYWGFWQLGRKVALSPFEIAAAFRSPMVNTGGTIDDILRENGSQPVQFGRIVTGDAAGQLGVAEPEFVERAHPAIGSAKREINATVTGVFSKRATQ